MFIASAPPPPGGDPSESLLEQLRVKQWGFVDGLLSCALATALRRESLRLAAEARFRAAGVGRGPSFRLDPAVRSDHVLWMDPQVLTPAQAELHQQLDGLRTGLNRGFFLGLRRFEGHLTHYPPGARYQKHVDRFRDASHRIVSFVLYLNRAWSVGDGGALRIYDPERPEQVLLDVMPSWNRTVVFFSDAVPHEVLPTRRRRLSVTGWFRDDD